jgi:TolB-like protein
MVIEHIRPVNIAVARFDNETGNPQIGAYSDRLTDLVVADLTAGAPKKFRIIGNAAALRGPREGRDIQQIGQSLGASYVILGQVQRTASGYRILAHLIHLPEQTHMEVVRYESKLEDGLPSEEQLGEGIKAEFLRRLGS